LGKPHNIRQHCLYRLITVRSESNKERIGFNWERLLNSRQSLHKTKIGFSKTVRYYVRFEVFTVVTMKNAVFWDVTP
jgi:hypothetical protein